MEPLASHIEGCLATLGTDGFAPAFASFVEALKVDQLMVFSILSDRATCLLSRHFSHAVLAEELATSYLKGWYLQDPLLPELLSLAPGTVQLRRLGEVEGKMGEDYRRIFFQAPGLVTKTTLLAAGRQLRLFVSFYQTGAPAPDLGPEIVRLAGRLALLHYEQVAVGDVPPPLSALSERERAVCLGILSGRKAEAIAAELEVAASTVITYRKRAYGKLGISSRAGLFAICGK
ncbi:helix-turn-helix transcriptional regulator [Roseibium sp.]|uniref:helix-turn-helix transcriptional regulator n=1 Tax=Roseibium sp. TaxID=1936156 RepID=UPI003D13058B